MHFTLASLPLKGTRCIIQISFSSLSIMSMLQISDLKFKSFVEIWSSPSMAFFLNSAMLSNIVLVTILCCREALPLPLIGRTNNKVNNNEEHWISLIITFTTTSMSTLNSLARDARSVSRFQTHPSPHSDWLNVLYCKAFKLPLGQLLLLKQLPPLHATPLRLKLQFAGLIKKIKPKMQF